MPKSLLAFFVAAGLALSYVRPAPEFAIHMPNGPQKLLSAYKGKVVLMAFFFTTCPHCQSVAGVLQGVQKDYAPKGVQILAGCFDENAASQVGQFNDLYVKNAFPVGWADRNSVFEFLNLSVMQQVFVPILVFIDKKGEIREQYIGDESYLRDPNKNIRLSLDELLKGPAVSRAAVKAPAKASAKTAPAR